MQVKQLQPAIDSSAEAGVRTPGELYEITDVLAAVRLADDGVIELQLAPAATAKLRADALQADADAAQAAVTQAAGAKDRRRAARVAAAAAPADTPEEDPTHATADLGASVADAAGSGAATDGAAPVGTTSGDSNGAPTADALKAAN